MQIRDSESEGIINMVMSSPKTQTRENNRGLVNFIMSQVERSLKAFHKLELEGETTIECFQYMVAEIYRDDRIMHLLRELDKAYAENQRLHKLFEDDMLRGFTWMYTRDNLIARVWLQKYADDDLVYLISINNGEERERFQELPRLYLRLNEIGLLVDWQSNNAETNTAKEIPL